MQVIRRSRAPCVSDHSTDYRTSLKTLGNPLRLLVDNEIFRLTVWTNPSNDFKRGADHVSTAEKVMTDVGVREYLRFP